MPDLDRGGGPAVPIEDSQTPDPGIHLPVDALLVGDLPSKLLSTRIGCTSERELQLPKQTSELALLSLRQTTEHRTFIRQVIDEGCIDRLSAFWRQRDEYAAPITSVRLTHDVAGALETVEALSSARRSKHQRLGEVARPQPIRRSCTT